MRFVVFLLSLAALTMMIRLPSAQARRELYPLSSQQTLDVRHVMTLVERTALLGRAEDCATLSPLPLYEGSPSAADWQTFCEAVTRKVVAKCADVSAMLIPDLHAFCLSTFSPQL